MSKIKSIMVACDFSDYTPKIMSYAVDLARDLHAKLLVVNIINQRDVYVVRKVESELPTYSVDKFIRNLEKERHEIIDKLLFDSDGKNLEVQKIIRVGVPFKELLQVIEDEKVDMLVMGTRGRGYIAGTLFGSTAEKVFRHCPVPLLSIRTEDR